MRARALVLVAMLLGACARTSGTVEIPANELPFPVAREPHTTATPVPLRGTLVYLARADRLTAVQRRVATDVPLAEGALRALFRGPTAREEARGITTALPGAVGLLGLEIREGVAHVDLSGEFQQPAESERVALRVAQVTWTLTGVPGVLSVQFSIDGEPASVTTEPGETVSRPVTRGDFAAFAPPT
jgi:spore germination protein GerM